MKVYALIRGGLPEMRLCDAMGAGLRTRLKRLEPPNPKAEQTGQEVTVRWVCH
ncbi:MAG: hypothetical protein JRI67_13275 [Deltaproteobacteria bacterium]|nr:hypothetical protein [Deltaproteobacteria bacterium]